MDTQDLRLTIQDEPEGNTRVDLMQGDRSISRLWVVHFTLRVGKAAVRMDGIAGVGTDEEFRNRGYSRRVLDATVEHMAAGDAALSMLYGIRNFYPKFGYATAGPDDYLALTELGPETPLPAGWRARPLAPADVPAVRRLYEQGTAGAVGAAIRAENGRVWTKLAETAAGAGADACRVVESPQGRLAGYAWRGKGFWYVSSVERHDPTAFVIGEVMANGAPAADAVLALCRAWAREDSAGRAEPWQRVLLSLPPEGPVAAAARLQSAEFISRCTPCGGSMARVMSLQRLLGSLLPELAERVRVAGWTERCALRLETDLGDITLAVGPGSVAIESGVPAGTNLLSARLPQSALARLALGALPPDDLLARLEEPPIGRCRELLEVLFPLRHPHLYLPDRY